MPAISLYLEKELIFRLKREAQKRRVSISCLVREALDKYFAADKRVMARERVFDLLKQTPLGEWEEAEKERELADACRD
ncbi:MAG: ribbon-helix-helix domain-containing protein [Candidatus Desulfofervidaceae bacterium]|nr:ribbon-helix-helix domain-containing protein [Candidatus Desulfofervidaceae bacterium]